MSINNQKGFTMLEVLIAIIIFSFGLLGLAGLQLVSLANNLSANSRSTATALAYDMADRMRANMQGAVASNYNNIAGVDNSCQAIHYDDVHASPVTCTAAQLAQDDVYDWKKVVAGSLASGTATVCIDSTPNTAACDGTGTTYAVRVNWNDKPKNDAATIKTVAIEFKP